MKTLAVGEIEDFVETHVRIYTWVTSQGDVLLSLTFLLGVYTARLALYVC